MLGGQGENIIPSTLRPHIAPSRICKPGLGPGGDGSPHVDSQSLEVDVLAGAFGVGSDGHPVGASRLQLSAYARVTCPMSVE